MVNFIYFDSLAREVQIMEKNLVMIMDINFYNTTRQSLLEKDLYPRLEHGEKSFLVTANPEFVMKSREDAEFKAILQSADYVIPDGIGIVKASNWIKDPLKERIPGFELMLDLLEYADKEKLSCYFLGAKEAVNEKAGKDVEKKYPGINVVGLHRAFFGTGYKCIADKIRQAGPELIFVSLGMRRQDTWSARHMPEFDKGLYMGVGGSFDTLTGEVKRAPQFWIKLNLEWFYRFLKQPTVRFKRLLKVLEFAVRMRFKRE